MFEIEGLREGRHLLADEVELGVEALGDVICIDGRLECLDPALRRFDHRRQVGLALARADRIQKGADAANDARLVDVSPRNEIADGIRGMACSELGKRFGQPGVRVDAKGRTGVDEPRAAELVRSAQVLAPGNFFCC